jgi:DNA modification methylase
MISHDLKVQSRSPAALHPLARNPRTHSKTQIRQIAASIKQFGFTNPVLVDRHGGIVAGHGRVEAAKLIGLESVPTIQLEDLSEAEIRAYVIADNRLAELAGWDSEILALELQGLAELDLDFDLTITGFETPEIDLLIGGLVATGEDEDPADSVPEPAPGPAVTRPGDLWCIGRHRLICGDALDPEIYRQLLGDARAQMVFTDPPYNVPIDGHVCGLGEVRHRDFAIAAGEMTEAEFTAFLAQAFENLTHHSADGAIHYVCMDWRHVYALLTAARGIYSELKNLCVWAKTNAGMGSFYRSQHELVFVFKAGTGPHINNVELGRHGRHRTNVWTYPGLNSFGKERDAALALHPTVKPVALVRDAILDASKRGGIVLDAFAGSGTTLVAAEKAGRRGYGIELDPTYCDVIVQRVEAVSGHEAILEATGERFAEIARQRASQSPTPEPGGEAPASEDGHVEG